MSLFDTLNVKTPMFPPDGNLWKVTPGSLLGLLRKAASSCSHSWSLSSVQVWNTSHSMDRWRLDKRLGFGRLLVQFQFVASAFSCDVWLAVERFLFLSVYHVYDNKGSEYILMSTGIYFFTHDSSLKVYQCRYFLDICGKLNISQCRNRRSNGEAPLE